MKIFLIQTYRVKAIDCLPFQGTRKVIHYYFNKHWDEKKNKEVFGHCYSKYGYRHNSILGVHIAKPPFIWRQV